MGEAALQLPDAALAGAWRHGPRAVPRQTPAELWGEAFDPGERLSVWQWADAHRELSRKESAEPGGWDTNRTPWLRFPMELLSVSHPAERVILQWGAQVGKTQTVLNFIGYCIDHEPAPIMLVLATLDTAKRYSRNRIDALVESTACLRTKVAEHKSRDQANSRLLKDFPGGYLLIVGANSAPALREASIRYLIAEEIDAYEADAGGEGDPISLAIRRTATYRGRRKIVFVSTPKRKGTSRIDRERRRAQQEWRYHVPCPSCGHAQELVRAQLRYDASGFVRPDAAKMRHDDDTANEIPPEIPGTTYECEACHVQISETDKPDMEARGSWVCLRDKGSLSVALKFPALHSTLGFSWGEAAAMQEIAKDDPSQEQILVNTVDADAFSEPTKAPAWKPLYLRREAYPIGVVPVGGRFLTAMVDVQHDRLEFELAAWGRQLRSWRVQVSLLVGDPETDEHVWAELDELLARDWPCAGGAGTLPIQCLAIDSGGLQTATQRVYTWARRHHQPFYGKQGRVKIRAPRTVMVTKGRDIWSRDLVVAEKVSATESARGLKVMGTGVSGLKREIYLWLRGEIGPDGQEPHGYMHFPTGELYDERYFQELTNEHVEVVRTHGRERERWVKDGPNEKLDLAVGNLAAACAFGIRHFREPEWRKIERGLPPGLLGPTMAPPVPAPPVQARVQPREPAPDTGGPPPRPSPPPVGRTFRNAWMGRGE